MTDIRWRFQTTGFNSTHGSSGVMKLMLKYSFTVTSTNFSELCVNLVILWELILKGMITVKYGPDGKAVK